MSKKQTKNLIILAGIIVILYVAYTKYQRRA